MPARGEREKRNLRVKMTDDERREVGVELACLLNEICNLEEEKKSVAQAAKREIDRKKIEAASLAHDVSSGAFIRLVDCQWTMNKAKRSWELIRLDTHEIVATKAMEAPDLQLELFEKEA